MWGVWVCVGRWVRVGVCMRVCMFPVCVPSTGLLIDLLPYLGRGITIGEFIEMNTGRCCVCTNAVVCLLSVCAVQETQLLIVLQ